MRLLAEEAGQVIVTLNVTWAHNNNEYVLTDSITIEVIFLSLVYIHTHLFSVSITEASYRFLWIRN